MWVAAEAITIVVLFALIARTAACSLWLRCFSDTTPIVTYSFSICNNKQEQQLHTVLLKCCCVLAVLLVKMLGAVGICDDRMSTSYVSAELSVLLAF